MIGGQIHGEAELRAKLAAIGARAEAASPAAVKAAGEIIQRAMSSRAPRATGRLASSISMDVSSSGDGATAKVGAGEDYDRFVQFGTRYMAPQAYGEEAADDSTASVAAAMAAVYKAAIT